MENLLDIANESGPPDARTVGGALLAADCILVGGAIGVFPSPSAVIGHALDEFIGEHIGNGIHAGANLIARQRFLHDRPPYQHELVIHYRIIAHRQDTNKGSLTK